jgi:hypothetical protein
VFMVGTEKSFIQKRIMCYKIKVFHIKFKIGNLNSI